MSRTTWTVYKTHSSVEFSVAHMHISTFRGRFGEVSGTLLLDEEDPAQTELQASVAVRSVETRDKGLYDKLMGDEFFSAESHPNITFRSTLVERRDPTHWRVEGELTIRGVTRPQTLEVEALGGGNNPFARVPMRAFRAQGSLDRGAFGMKWNVPLDIGAPYLGETVQLSLQIEVLQQA